MYSPARPIGSGSLPHSLGVCAAGLSNQGQSTPASCSSRHTSEGYPYMGWGTDTRDTGHLLDNRVVGLDWDNKSDRWVTVMMMMAALTFYKLLVSWLAIVA